MKTFRNGKHERMWRTGFPISDLLHGIILSSLAFFLFSCASDPRKVDVELPESKPMVKTTSFTEALNDLGLMSEIYGTEVLKIQSSPIVDNTGASISTGSEIPRDVTEIIKTTLNSIGGNVVFIPFDPAFIQNQMVTGYSDFENKTIPNVVLSGGITEFDRGLRTKGENTDARVQAEMKGFPDFLPSKNVGVRYGDEGKQGLARITLDFNLLDFQTMAGISKMNAVNTMEVHKAVAGKELGISLFGQNFGLKGTIKKVQGRHAAVRLLVELSMVQIVGKYLAMPYWRVLGDDAIADQVVTRAVKKYYSALDDAQATAVVQEWLYLYGYDVPQTGELDQTTREALNAVDPSFNIADGTISSDNFVNTYVNIPITFEARKRREMLANLAQEEPIVEPAPASYEEVQAVPESPVQVEDVQPPQETALQAEEVQQQPPVQQEAYATTPKYTPKNRTGIGRILRDEDW